MSDSPSRHSLVSGFSILLILVAVMAWTSRPSEESFRRFAEREASAEADGAMEQVAGKVLAKVALQVTDWEHIDYGLFSVVVIHDFETVYVGAFGVWGRVDAEQDTQLEQANRGEQQ